MNGEDDDLRYEVIINQDELYGIWPWDRENAVGWTDEGGSGTKQECLDHLAEVWTDMRPLSLRRQMEEKARREGTPGDG